MKIAAEADKAIANWIQASRPNYHWAFLRRYSNWKLRKLKHILF